MKKTDKEKTEASLNRVQIGTNKNKVPAVLYGKRTPNGVVETIDVTDLKEWKRLQTLGWSTFPIPKDVIKDESEEKPKKVGRPKKEQ